MIEEAPNYVTGRMDGVKNWINAQKFPLLLATGFFVTLITVTALNSHHQGLLQAKIEELEQRQLENKKVNENVEEKVSEKLKKLDDEIQKTAELSEDNLNNLNALNANFSNKLERLEIERLMKLENTIKKTDFHIKAASAINCEEIMTHGYREDGYYSINPNGRYSGQESFEVYCSFQEIGNSYYDENYRALTIIPISQPETMKIQTEDSRDYWKRIHYNATPSQIQTLIKNSGYCEQTIEFACTAMPLHNSDVNYAYWKDNKGKF